MANKEHLEQLKNGALLWNQWREDHPEVQPDLSGLSLSRTFYDIDEQDPDKIDLQGINLTKTNLQGATFTDIDLRSSKLMASNLEGASLSNVDLQSANLEDANLQEVVFTNSNLQKANFEDACLYKAKFWNGNIQDAHFWNVNLKRAVLSGANLKNTDFQGADLKNANLEDADLRGANLWHANLEEINLSNANLEQAILSETNFTRANLHRVNLRNADLGAANLEKADLLNADFRGANLARANFVDAHVTGVKYDRQAKYRGIRTAACYGSPRFKRFAQDQDFIEEFRSSTWDPFIKLRSFKACKKLKPLPLGSWGYWLWNISSDCGRSLSRWAILAVCIAVGFGYIYFSLGEQAFNINAYGDGHLSWSLESMIYYSVVIFSTLGFGDIAPKTVLAARWVMVEVAIGYIMLGGLISILADKIARRA